MSTKQTTPELLRDSVPVMATVQALRNQILDGEVDPLAAFINLGRMEKIISEVKKDASVIDCALNAYSRYGQKSVKIGDCEVMESEAGIKYDFSECGDSEYDDLVKTKAEIEQRIKNRELFLKSVPHKMVVADPETGEMFTVTPPTKSSKTILKLSFKSK